MSATDRGAFSPSATRPPSPGRVRTRAIEATTSKKTKTGDDPVEAPLSPKFVGPSGEDGTGSGFPPPRRTAARGASEAPVVEAVPNASAPAMPNGTGLRGTSDRRRAGAVTGCARADRKECAAVVVADDDCGAGEREACGSSSVAACAPSVTGATAVGADDTTSRTDPATE